MKIHMIVDKSGSMGMVRDATISGINEYITGLGSGEVTLTLFDTLVEVKKPTKIKEWTPLTHETYVPSGMTALYDAVCYTLKNATDTKGKNLVVIMTDGQENSSKEYSQREMKKLVEDLTSKGNWTFVFLGANQDAYAEAQKYGIPTANAVTFNATPTGSSASFDILRGATMAYAASSSKSTGAFYSQAQQRVVEETK